MPQPNQFRWRKTDESIFLAHCPNHAEQFLFYARIYTIGQGYTFSETNNLILNLKKSPQAPPTQLYYKRQAICRFAQEVISLFQAQLSLARLITLVPMPPSKERSHPAYDDRMEQVAEAIAAEFDNMEWLPLLQATGSRASSHLRSSRRNPDEIYQLMQIDQAEADRYRTGSMIALIDDILTSGAQFATARRRLAEVFPAADVIGIFWAKAVSADDFLQ